MNHFIPIITVISSAFKTAGIALSGLVIFALPLGGPLILLYYWAFVMFYFLPVVLLIGALIGWISLFLPRADSEQKKASTISWRPISIVGVSLFFY